MSPLSLPHSLQLSKLKHSYQKLQSKQLKESREGAKSREEDRTEVTRLNGKIEVRPGSFLRSYGPVFSVLLDMYSM